jgi:nicotinate-nucleotide adenylyltransferase
MKTGVLGGTFDPIHLGHVGAAQAAQRALALDGILLVPSRIPPHRRDATRASADDRFHMASITAASHPKWSASRIELDREGPSYTFDTLTELRRMPSSFFFIIGVDAFAEIATWSRYPAVLDLAHFVVVSRPGFTLDSLQHRVPDLADRMTTPARFDFSAQSRIILLEAPTPAISSTEIRRRASAGQDLAGLVPDAVADYIHAHRLYRGQ